MTTFLKKELVILFFICVVTVFETVVFRAARSSRLITKTRTCNIQRHSIDLKLKTKDHQINFDVFLILAQNIDRGYTLETPR